MDYSDRSEQVIRVLQPFPKLIPPKWSRRRYEGQVSTVLVSNTGERTHSDAYETIQGYRVELKYLLPWHGHRAAKVNRHILATLRPDRILRCCGPNLANSRHHRQR